MLIQRWLDGTERYDRPGESVLAATSGDEVVGIGGLTRCPHVDGALRVRRFYVLPGWRRRGVARALAAQLVDHGFRHAETITCNARASAAAPRFWESVDFVPTSAIEGVTHWRHR